MIAPRVLILSSALDQSPKTVWLERPMTVGEVVAFQSIPLGLPTIAVLTDPAGYARPVMRGAWHVQRVTAGHQLAFVPVPGKGGLTGILSAVASIAMAVFAPWAAGFLAGMTGLTGAALNIATGVIGAGIMIAGQFILSRLMPQPGAGPSAETVYTATASGNRAMPLEPIPVLYGRLRYPPPFASRPYAEFVDNDQYLYQLHCLGVGHIDPLRWEIGDTLVWTKEGGFRSGFNVDDTQIQIIRPGQAITLFPANVVTSPSVDGQQAPDAPAWLGPFAVTPPGTQVTRIACDYAFPLGLVSINKKGGGDTLSREVRAEYRPIDNAGNPTGAYQPLFTRNHSAKTRTPQRFSRAVNVPVGRYEVRLAASGADQSDATGGPPTRLNRVVWAGLRGYVDGFETPADVTLIATRIRANEHLSREASGQYMFTSQRLLPVRRSGAWTAPEATRNPAWAVADMMVRLGIPESDFDLGWLTAYADLWDDRGDFFDGLFDRRWQATQAIDAILRVGRAYHVRLGSIIGFVRDEPKQVRRMAFTPDTIVAGSIKRHDVWFSEDAPDHLEVTYLDGDSWTEHTVLAAIGAVGQDKPQTLDLFGITEHDHAWREGIFQAAENAFRRSFRTFQCEREGRMLVRGDPVVLHDPMHELLGFGRIDARAGNVLTIDRELDHPGGTAILAIRDKRGNEWGPCRVDSVAGRQVTLNQADRLAVERRDGTLTAALPDSDRQEPAHATLLRVEQRLFDGLVVEARAIGSELWDVTLVNDDPRVYAVDNTEVVPSPWTPPTMLAPMPDRPVLSDLYAAALRSTMAVELQAGWRPAAGADRYIAEISYDDGAIDNPADANWTPIHDSAATRLNVPIAPQPVTVRVAPIGRLRGAWVYRHVADIPNLLLPDEVEVDIERQVHQWFRSLSDWLDEDSPLHPLWTDIEGLDEKVGIMEAELAGIGGADGYDPAFTYVAGTIVQFAGGLYRAIQDVPRSTPPPASSHWSRIGDYAPVGEAVAALNARVGESESEIARTASGFRSTTRDSRRVYSALMADAIGEIDKAGTSGFEASDQLKATAAVAQWTETEISRVDGVLTVHAGEFLRVQAEIDGKASTSITQALQSTVTQQGSDIAAISLAITAVQGALPGKADTSVVSALQTTVTQHGSDIAAISSAVTSVQSALPGKADSSVVSALQATVTQQGQIITAQASRTDDLFAAAGGSTNAIMAKWEVVSGPSGYTRYGLRLLTSGGAERAITMFGDVPNSASLKTRWAWDAEEFAFIDTSTGQISPNPLIYSDGVWRMNIAHLGLIRSARLLAQNNRMDVDLNWPRILVSDNS